MTKTTGGDTMTGATLITDEQVFTLNAARTVLARISKDAHMEHDSQVSGMLYAQAENAGDALFRLLVWYHTHADGDLSKEQLHNTVSDADAA